MTRAGILEGLGLLGAAKTHTLHAPTTALIAKLAPHLESHEIAGLLTDARDSKIVSFIGPGVLIRGAEHVYVLTKQQGVLQLQWTGVFRRKESFHYTVLPSNWKQADYEYRERAANYAAVHYGNQLQWDDSRECVTWFFMYASGPREVRAAYRRTWAEMLQLANGRCPFLQVLDAQLCAATLHYTVGAEIFGDRASRLVRVCGNCGGGIDADGCTYCHTLYTSASVVDSNTPAHLHLLEEVGLFDKFNVSPINAIKVHYAKWAADSVRQPTRQVPHDRVITFSGET